MYTLEYSDETAAAFFIKIITIHKVIWRHPYDNVKPQTSQTVRQTRANITDEES
jgi:hypothetical protein